MSPRLVMRYVQHSITHASDQGITAELFCAADGCGLSSGPYKSPDDAQDWALKHTGRNPGHDLFRREYIDHARVIRAE